MKRRILENILVAITSILLTMISGCKLNLAKMELEMDNPFYCPTNTCARADYACACTTNDGL